MARRTGPGTDKPAASPPAARGEQGGGPRPESKEGSTAAEGDEADDAKRVADPEETAASKPPADGPEKPVGETTVRMEAGALASLAAASAPPPAAVPGYRGDTPEGAAELETLARTLVPEPEDTVVGVFPSYARRCHGCTTCATLLPLSCSCGAQVTELTGRQDVVIDMGESFLANHQGEGHRIRGACNALPYPCSKCEERPTGTEHSVECINYWNKRAAVRRTGQDGILLRISTLAGIVPPKAA